MTVIVNYFNKTIKIFDNIISINDFNEKNYILKDIIQNDIRIPRENVEYILINHSKYKGANV